MPSLNILNDKILCEQILKVFPGVLVITSREGKILWTNTPFEKLTGFSLEEVIDKSPKEFLHGPDTDPVIVEYMSNCLKAGKEFETNVLNYRKDGTFYWIHLKAIPVYNKGKLKYWIGTKHLLIEHDEMLNEINQLKQMIHTNEVR